jgi:hypothetical protein
MQNATALSNSRAVDWRRAGVMIRTMNASVRASFKVSELQRPRSAPRVKETPRPGGLTQSDENKHRTSTHYNNTNRIPHSNRQSCLEAVSDILRILYETKQLIVHQHLHPRARPKWRYGPEHLQTKTYHANSTGRIAHDIAGPRARSCQKPPGGCRHMCGALLWYVATATMHRLLGSLVGC